MSNTGTWMQRVAQDWMVLQLTGNSGTAIGITTGLQFLPFLLLSPFAGLVADRIPKRRLLQITNVMMAAPALVLGVLAVTGTAEIWHVYVLAFVLGVGAAFDAPARQSLRLRDRRRRRPHQRRRPQLRQLQRRPASSARARRRADRRPRRRRDRHRLGDPRSTRVSYAAPILALQRLDTGCPRPRRSSRPRARGMIREGVRYVRGRPDLLLVLAVVFFTGTFGLNFQMTSALMATEVFDKGATGVRPARHLHGGRLADRGAARGPPGAGPAPADHRSPR